MRLIITYFNINLIRKWKDAILYLKSEKDNQELFINLTKTQSILNEKIFRIYIKDDLLLFQKEEGSSIYTYNEKYIKKFLNKECFISKRPINQFIISEKEKNGYTYFLLNESLELTKIPFSPNFIYKNFIIDHWNREVIKNYNFKDQKLLWEKDISTYGKNKTLNSEQIIPNEIDGQLLGFEDSIYVPLQGGQLLCLDIYTGEKKWIQDYNGRSGFYSLQNDKIYKHDGLSLLEIDVKTGVILRSKIFSANNESELQNFYALNTFWTYDDVIILYGLDNRVILLNRQTFDLSDSVNLQTGISTDENNVIWHENKLYILDLNNTLHVFEKD